MDPLPLPSPNQLVVVSLSISMCESLAVGVVSLSLSVSEGWSSTRKGLISCLDGTGGGGDEGVVLPSSRGGATGGSESEEVDLKGRVGSKGGREFSLEAESRSSSSIVLSSSSPSSLVVRDWKGLKAVSPGGVGNGADSKASVDAGAGREGMEGSW